jgi:toxin ParE1/3/4
MIWNVEYTEDAKQDLQNIYDHISDVLQVPVTAAKQSNRIMDAVDKLDHMPLRFRLYEHEPWRSKGLRVMSVDNYLVFYLPDEPKGIVWIIRIMYGGRDIPRHLSDPAE